MLCKINCSESQWSYSPRNRMNAFTDKNFIPPTLGVEEKA